LFCSAYKNKGVHALLDGVLAFLPNPAEVVNKALDLDAEEREVALSCDPALPLCGLAFKLEEGKYGQLTYLRIYQGSLRKGDSILNLVDGKRVKVPRLVQMHANEMTDVEEASAGDIVALFGVDCRSGTTFTDGKARLSLSSMYVPDAVISLALKTKNREASANFSKALARFVKEDPTFRVSTNEETSETIIAGMGELHLDIYVERMKREYGVECEVGQPAVSFRETLRARAPFDYLHKKQSGGSGQYGRVVGYIEPLDEGTKEPFAFQNHMVGNSIPPEFLTAVERGFFEALGKGALTGHPVTGVRVVLTDGAAHAVDSNELAFKLAAQGAFRQAFGSGRPTVLEPVMNVEVEAPLEYQGTIVGQLNQRKGTVANVDTRDGSVVIEAQVPLDQMFGYSTDLRSVTQGKGEFSMEYLKHAPTPKEKQESMVAEYQKQLAAKKK
jgi:elongation factor G